MKLPYALLGLTIFVFITVMATIHVTPSAGYFKSEVLSNPPCPNSAPTAAADSYTVHGSFETPVESPVTPLFLEGGKDEATVAVRGRHFAWHDQPGFYDFRNSPPANFYRFSANFLVYAQNGDKRCEVRFHIWQRYEKGVLTTGVSPGNF